jgi:Holliday junction resolvase RusA-like endonuclease
VTITFAIDLPPSVNRLWRHSGKRVYLDPRYVAWKRVAGWQIKATRPGRFPYGTHVSVTIKAGKAKRARDIDNLGKATLDLVQAVGIIGNDRDVRDLHIAWDDAVLPGKAKVEVREIEREAA